MNGKLYICPTPIGNLEDITLRVLRTLREVDLIAAEDTRHTQKLLNHFEIKKPMISYFEHNKRERGEEILRHIMRGQDVALVSDAGMPAISDPGEDLVRLCAQGNIMIVPLPGANAALTALVASGLSTGKFSFQGFLSVNRKNRFKHLGDVRYNTETMIFYEAPHKLIYTLYDMLEVFGDRKIAVCRELTKTYEEILRTTLSGAVNHFENTPPKGEFVLVIEGAKLVTDMMEDATLEQLYQVHLEAGASWKEAIKLAAQDKGMDRREAYAIIKGNKKHDDIQGETI